ncbi:NUDIX domain-containing protein [Clostridium sp. MCC353]|uniref:NUDIX domain-containing protein n=1 Tax=Clostridium sp. MCC353 TaxID=2592646 RepID=UPI001C0316CC|nr:NUDIX domain-containing protein [Clostridium sp. MCC353]
MMPKTNMTTLCYLEKDDSYLMMHRVKKVQDVNKDKWIGVGGHFEEGESPEECLKREVKEETGLTLTDFRFRGIITFISDKWQPEYMCLYTSKGFEGEMTACSEGTLEWVKKEDVLSLNLWEGDKIFFQLLKEEAPFFSLKLRYEGDRLMEAVLDGKELELLEELDEEGNKTGRVRARFLMHMDGTPHATSHIWLIRPNHKSGYDILLQKRSAGKDAFPGCYDISSAGHVPAGSGYMESALRELKEELGISACEGDLEYIGTHSGKDEAEFYGKPFINHEISHVYLYKKPVDISGLRLQKEEVESVMWMDFKECRMGMEDGSLNHCLSETEMELLERVLMKGC